MKGTASLATVRVRRGDPPQLPPGVRIGALEVWPSTEIALVATFGGALYLLLEPTPERLQTALRLTVLGYVLVQGPRLLHELGHAVGGYRAGRPARRLV